MLYSTDTKIKAWGDSLVIVLNKDARDLLKASEGKAVNITIKPLFDENLIKKQSSGEEEGKEIKKVGVNNEQTGNNKTTERDTQN